VTKYEGRLVKLTGDGADAMAREWVLHNEKISSVLIETITNPNYLVVLRL
jgi:hypothetical protein